MRRLLSGLVLAFVSVAVCVLVAEWVLGALNVLEAPPQATQGHPRRGYQPRANYDGETKYGVRLKINSRNLRSPEIAVPKPAGTKRVLVIGDSVTFGWGVDESETFSRKLESSLRRQLACPLEVVNAGVSGYGTIEEADYFLHEGLELQPDVVVVYYVENDNLSVSHFEGPIASFLKDWVVYRSNLINAGMYAWRLTRWKLQARKIGGDRAAYEAVQLGWADAPGTPASLAALREIAAAAKEHGVAAILANHPNNLGDRSLDAPRDALLREVAATTGMAYVDVAPAVLPYKDHDLAVSKTDLHPNGFAHGLIAAALEPAVRDALGCAQRAAAN
jgi:lysophospholipase L1-like esterase